MSMKLRIASPMWQRLRTHHLAAGKRKESLTFVFARSYGSADSLTFVVPHNAPWYVFAEDCFINRTAANVRLDVEVLRGMLVEFAATDYDTLINVHDHWFDRQTRFSGIDDQDDLEFDRYLRREFEPMLRQHANIGPERPIHNLSVVLAQEGLCGRLVDSRKDAHFQNLDAADIVGDRFTRLSCGLKKVGSIPHTNFSRQRDFVPEAAQALLAELKVAVVGCGGLGSIVSESLGRLGIGELLLIDDDLLEESNLNRWQGGSPSDVGSAKSDVLARRMLELMPETGAGALVGSVHDIEVQQRLIEADVIVGALDNDAARFLLNRISLQYVLPYFDAGSAVIRSDAGNFDFCTRFFAVLPGTSACIECTSFELIDRAATSRMFTDPATVAAQRAAGYISDTPEAATPSVYALNQRSASILVMELLNFVVGFQAQATVIRERWNPTIIERSDRSNFPDMPGECCVVCNLLAGSAGSEALPRLGTRVSGQGSGADIEHALSDLRLHSAARSIRQLPVNQVQLESAVIKTPCSSTVSGRPISVPWISRKLNRYLTLQCPTHLLSDSLAVYGENLWTKLSSGPRLISKTNCMPINSITTNIDAIPDVED